MKTIPHWLAGEATTAHSSKRAPVWNPATGKQTAEVVLGSQKDVDQAVQSARSGFEKWSASSLSQRTKILFSFRELVSANAHTIAEVISSEHGKVLDDAKGEVQRGLEVIEYACGVPSLLKGDYTDQASRGVDLYSYREPLGVAVGISPFNFPAMVPLWMFPIAIACGNSFILKPSERDPSASILLADMFSKAGLPDGVFNVLQGDGDTVNALITHADVSAVSFVGSTPIARHIYETASASNKRVQALGGAKNHAVVLPGADLSFAAEQIASAAFGSAGERCMAISAVIAVGDIGDELVERLSEKAKAIKVGAGSDPSSEMGPVITRDAQQRIAMAIGSGDDQGADLVVDGRELAVESCADGFFVGPTVFDNVTPSMDVYRREIFGPVLSVLRANSLHEAIELINANEFANGTAIFTSDGEAAREFQRRVKVGMIGVNVPVPVPMAYYSFGGWKASLFGDKHMHGPEGVSFFTRAKVITARWPSAGLSDGPSYQFPTAS